LSVAKRDSTGAGYDIWKDDGSGLKEVTIGDPGDPQNYAVAFPL
jgi:hypothetical protein